MGELIVWLLLFILLAVIAFYAGWILLAVLARVFSFVLLYWAITFVGGGLAGIGFGVVVPVRVFLGRSRVPFRQLRPADVVAGEVLRRSPRSPNREYGWDDAWPSYMPYQAREDAAAVGRALARVVGLFWRWYTRYLSRAATGSGSTAVRTAGWSGRLLTRVGWTVLVLPAFLGFALGTWATGGAWFVIMGVLGGILTALRQIGLWGYRWFDVADRRRLRATAKCPHCYAETSLPGYRCANDECTVVHWTMLPGPLGLFTRRCSCGYRNPNTVSAAARLLTPVCPSCRSDLVAGSGGRQTLQIAVIGSIGAGKSRLLSAFVVETTRAAETAQGRMTPLDTRAERYAARATDIIRMQGPTVKTQHGRPVGLPFLVERGSARVELQVLDAAGESFATWDDTAELRYLDTAGALVLALDPLALPHVTAEFERSPFAASVLVATGDQEEAYAAAVDRLRAESVPVHRRALAVVLTKGDVLRSLPSARDLDVTDGAAIRAWLVERGSDLMVKRFEKDFRTVRYFLVDAMQSRELDDRSNPWWVLDWLMDESRSSLRLGAAVAPPSSNAPDRNERSHEEQSA